MMTGAAAQAQPDGMPDAEEAFRAAMIADGLIPPANIIADGHLHRFATGDRPGDDAGWYVVFADAPQAGEFGDWRTGVRKRWRVAGGRHLTRAEDAAHRARLAEIRRARDAEQKRRHTEAAQKAAALWQAARPAGADHPYLMRKRVQPVETLRELLVAQVARVIGYTPQAGGVLLTGRFLIAPVVIGGAISTAEMIDEHGRKSALASGAKKGGFWAAQKLPDGNGDGLTLLIGEGVATVLSATEATGHPAVAALSAGNLIEVATAMHTRYPAAALVIMADLIKTTGHPDPQAIEAARAVGGLLAVPSWDGDRPEGMTDMNDLAASEGTEAVRRCVRDARRVRPDSANGHADGAGAGPEAEWPQMQPLPVTDYDMPTLDPELMPAGLRDWIADASDRLQVPPEMIAAPAVVSMATLVGRTVGIYPKRHDDWIVVSNLWGMIVGRPGTLKSPAVQEGTRFLRHLAAMTAHEYADAKKKAKIELDVIEADAARAKHEAQSKKGNADQYRIQLEEIDRRRKEETPRERRYMTQDATVEKLGEILLANPRGILLLRDELSGWLRMLDKPGREGDREFYLEGWNGNGSHAVDRIGRGTLYIPALCVSVFGTIQPGKHRAYRLAAEKGGTGDDGLLQRHQIAVWPNVSGDWHNVDRWPDSCARERAATVFSALDVLTAEKAGAVADGDGIPALRFAADAQDLFNAWRAELETRLRSEDLKATPSYEDHVSKYRSLMPSLALLWHLADVVDGGADPGPVSLSSARIAAAWVDFLDAHAKRLYAVESDPSRGALLALAARIRAGDVSDGTTLRDVSRPQWSGLRTADSVRAAADGLKALGWVRVEERETGGRPSPVLRLHPRLRGDA